MAHGNAIVHANHIELYGHTARLTHLFLYGLDKFPKMHMSRDNIYVGVGYAYKWLVKVLIGKTAGPKQSPMWRSFYAFFDLIASIHNYLLIYIQK